MATMTFEPGIRSRLCPNDLFLGLLYLSDPHDYKIRSGTTRS